MRAQARAPGPGTAHHDHAEHDGHEQLCDRRAQSRAGDPQTHAVDERDVQHRVERRSRGGDDERRTGVAQPAQDAGRGLDQEHPREPRRGPPQVGHGVPRDVALGAQRGHRERGGEQEHDDEHGADPEGEPHPVDAGLQRRPLLARAGEAGHRRRRRVREEDAQPDEREEHVARERQAGELGGAQVTDHRAVDEDEDGLGDEGTQGGYRKGEDLPVDGSRESGGVARLAQLSFLHRLGVAYMQVRGHVDVLHRGYPQLGTGLSTHLCTAWATFPHGCAQARPQVSLHSGARRLSVSGACLLV